MSSESPIFSYTYVSQAKTITYGYSLANLSCTLSANDVKINTPNVWGVTKPKSDINIQTKNHDLSDGTSGAITWGNPGTSISIDNIDCNNQQRVGWGVGEFVIENLGGEDLRIYGVILNSNGNLSAHIQNIKLSKGVQTFSSNDTEANGGSYYFVLGLGERVTGTFDLQTSDDDMNSEPDNLPPSPTLEVYSDDLNPDKPQTEVDDYGIGNENLQSKWDIDVTWSVTDFTTG